MLPMRHTVICTYCSTNMDNTHNISAIISSLNLSWGNESVSAA